MLQINDQWMADFDVATVHDAFVCQQAQIKASAAEANPSLHKAREDDTQRDAWLAALLGDAAKAHYHADDLWLLYNGVLWSEGLFYREPIFAPLFQHSLLSSIDRAQQLNVLLNLDKRRSFVSAPYQTLEQDALAQRLLRIQQYHVVLASADEHSIDLHNGYLMVEYRSLLLALVEQAIEGQAAHWQAMPCESSDMVHISSAKHKRRLQLRISQQIHTSAEADKNEQGQSLILALPFELENMSIKDYQYYLHAYLQQNESASGLAKNIQEQQQVKESSHA